MSSAPLAGRSALVTGVSRRRGIGYGIAQRLAELGADLFIAHHARHDAEQPWGADDLDAVRVGLRSVLHPGARLGDADVDLADPQTPPQLIDAAYGLTGHLDILVCNHARSGGDGSIFDMNPDRLDGHWSVNTRSTILLTAAFARRFTGLAPAKPVQPGERVAPKGPVDEHRTARVFWLTSGQQHGPMP